MPEYRVIDIVMHVTLNPIIDVDLSKSIVYQLMKEIEGEHE